MTGSKPKPQPMPEPAPPPQVSVAAPEITTKSYQKRRRGYQSTILAGGLNKRNQTDKLG